MGKIKTLIYPFNEGDDYWTVEDSGELIWSCWDEQSEEIHDANPNRIYYLVIEDMIYKRVGTKTIKL